jgi:hypothetical protein
LRIMMRDISANLAEITYRRIGPNYLEVHAVAQDSTNCSTSW